MTDLERQTRHRAARLTGAVVIGIFVVGLALVGALVGWAVGSWLLGSLVGAVAGVAATAAAVVRSVDLVLSTSRAVPADERLHARLFNLVEGLRVSAGVPMPRLYVIDDDAPNALVVATSPDTAAIALTTGLLRLTDRVELEGVLAHALVRIRTRDVVPATLAAVVVGWPVLLAERLMRRRWWNGGREARRADRAETPAALAGAGAALLRLVARPVAWTMRRMVDDGAVAHADVDSCAITRYPPGLAAALGKCAAETTVTHGASAVTAHLWLCQPLSGVGDDGLFASVHRLFDVHPPLAERIDVLREL